MFRPPVWSVLEGDVGEKSGFRAVPATGGVWLRAVGGYSEPWNIHYRLSIDGWQVRTERRCGSGGSWKSMSDRLSHNYGRALLLEIIETLEESGLESEMYQLQNSIDVEALERLVNSAEKEFEIRFSVEERRIRITQDRVELIDTPADHD